MIVCSAVMVTATLCMQPSSGVLAAMRDEASFQPAVAQSTQESVQNAPVTSTEFTGSKYAYAFLLAGCDPSTPSYRGFFYNILVAMHVLRESGSAADLVVMVRMAHNATDDHLTSKESQWLESLGAKIMYLPKATSTEGFSEAQLLKFHILTLTQYRRVLYMDSDIMPLCNLDYWFGLSDSDENPLLKENLIMAWTKEPANGGFFMLKPGDYEQLKMIIKAKNERGASLPYPHFDLELGWGHSLAGNNTWVSFERKKQGNRWSFYAAHSDQGLLYYWTKFVKKNVSIVTGYDIENWASDGAGGDGRLEETLRHPTKNLTCLADVSRKRRGFLRHPAYGGRYMNMQPHGEIIHFYGPFKPWRGQVEPEVESKWDAESGRSYWFYNLRKLNRELGIGLDFDNWEDLGASFATPPLGNGRLVGKDRYS